METPDAVTDLLQRLEIKPDGWDAIMVGDGSGSKWPHEAGWAVLVLEKFDLAPITLYGAMSSGTVNIAETMAYIHALLWYQAALSKRGDKSHKTVHVVTDSEYVQQMGAGGSDKAFRRANSPLWTAIKGACRRGIAISWHHIDRDTNDLNVAADAISREVRLLVKNSEMVSLK